MGETGMEGRLNYEVSVVSVVTVSELISGGREKKSGNRPGRTVWNSGGELVMSVLWKKRDGVAWRAVA